MCKLTNTSTIHRIPATDNHAGHQIVLVLITKPSHQMGRHFHRRHPSRLDGQLTQIMLDVIRQGLRIGRTSRSAAPDVIVKLGNLVGNAVGHVGAGGHAGVGTEDDAAGERDGDDGRAGGEFAGTEVPSFGRFAVVGTAHGGGCVVMVGVREGAHLEGIQASKSGGISREERHRRLW